MTDRQLTFRDCPPRNPSRAVQEALEAAAKRVPVEEISLSAFVDRRAGEEFDESLGDA